MKKKVLLGLFASAITATALTSCGESDQTIKNQTNIAAIQKDVDSLKEALDTAKGELNESIANLNRYLKIEKIAAKGDVIASLEAKIKELEDSSDENFDTIIEELRDIENSLSNDYVTQETYGEAINRLNNIDSNITSMKAQITTLEAAKATVTKVEELETALNNKSTELQGKIDLIEAEIGDIITDGDNVVSLQEQINAIKQQIEDIYLDDDEIVSLQEEINAIKQQLIDFSINELKGDLVYQLSDSYATFVDEMDEIQRILTVEYSKNVEEQFMDIYKKYNHEMYGTFRKGITLITLAENEEAARNLEAEYEMLIANFVNPTKFELMKLLDRAIIDDIDDNIDIESGYEELTIREKLDAEVVAVEWFDDDELELFEIQKEDTDEVKTAKAKAYKEATQAKIDLMNAAVSKAHAISSFLTTFNTAKKSIVETSLKGDKYAEVREVFLGLLEGENGIYDLEEYYSCTDTDIELEVIDPDTQAVTKILVNDLEYQLEVDTEAIDLVLAEVADYLSLEKYIIEQLNAVETGNGKYKNIDSKVNEDTSTELDTFDEVVRGVLDVDNYAKLDSTKAASTEQLTNDKAEVDLYIAKGKSYDDLIGYCNTKITGLADILKSSTEEQNEKATITTLLNGVHVFDNYITADLVISIPEGNTDTTLKSIEMQYNEDKAKADLLVVRASTFKTIYDAVNAAQTGLVAYINAKTTKVESTDTELFVADLKTKFKAEFTDLAVASKYDTAVANFAEEKDFTAYSASIVGTEGKLDLIKKNVDVFADILVKDAAGKKTINDLINLSAAYKTAFIDNFKAYATYDTNNTNTKSFTKKENFDKYYTDTVKAKIDNIVAVAKYEDSLIAKRNSVDTAINEAYTTEKISLNVKNYLLGITAQIYTANTSVTTDEQSKLVTAQTIASDAYTNVEAKLAAVEAAILTFNSVDVAAAKLEANLNIYKENQMKYFLDSNYKYRDDEVYAATAEDVDKYKGYNQSALAAWNTYVDDFDTEIDEITYEYVVPTDEKEINYDAFVTFVASLETPTQINERYNQIVLWYTEDTAEKPKAGKLFTITALFEKLDAEMIDGCRTYFIGALTDLTTNLSALVDDEHYQSNLNDILGVYTNYISGQYGTTTASIISKYEDGVKALNDKYIEYYKPSAISRIATEYTTCVNKYLEYQEEYSSDALDAINNSAASTINACKTTEEIDAACAEIVLLMYKQTYGDYLYYYYDLYYELVDTDVLEDYEISYSFGADGIREATSIDDVIDEYNFAYGEIAAYWNFD